MTQTSATSGMIWFAVIIIIAALAIASYVGVQALLKASVVRSVLAEIHTHRHATAKFHQHYLAWPGDYNQASATWPEADTQDGNQDGFIFGTTHEELTSWQHLSLAGYQRLELDHSFTEKQSSGVNIPASDAISGGYILRFATIHGHVNNFLILAGDVSLSLGADVISPYDVYEIDRKADDGYPTSGNILAEHMIGGTGCVVAGEYVKTSRELECHVYVALRK